MLALLRSRWHRYPVAFPALVLALWLLLAIGWRPLALPDEGRYATVALDMARSGHWTIPLLNGLPFFHKPPLFYWISATALDVFGASAWASRLASALGAWLMGMGLYLFLRQHANATLARWSLLLLATLPLFFGAAQYVNLDMLVAGIISLTTLAGAHAALRMLQGRGHGGWLWTSYLLAGLGILAKGLIGFVLPGAILLLWLLWLRQWRVLLRMLSLPGALLLAAITLPWFYLVDQRYPGFFHYFFVYQHFQRYTQTGFNNQHPFWFYVPVVILASLPWTLWLPGMVRRWWQQRPAAATLLQATASTDTARMLQGLWWIWLAVIIGFFSLPASKLVGYILPCLPAWAVLLTQGVLQPAAKHAQRPWRTLLAAAVLCLTVIAAVALVLGKQSSRVPARQVQAAFQPHDQIVMLDEYRYDVPFYLDMPLHRVWVVSDWSSPEIMKKDNWRKELVEAAVFDRPLGATVLVEPAQLVPRMCQVLQQQGTVWLWASQGAAQRYPFLAQQAPEAPVGEPRSREALWKFSGTAGRTLLGCP